MLPCKALQHTWQIYQDVCFEWIVQKYTFSKFGAPVPTDRYCCHVVPLSLATNNRTDIWVHSDRTECVRLSCARTYVIVSESLGAVKFDGRPGDTHNENAAALCAPVGAVESRARCFVAQCRTLWNTKMWHVTSGNWSFVHE